MSGVHKMIAMECGNGVRGLGLRCGRQGRGRESWAVALELLDEMRVADTFDGSQERQGVREGLFGDYPVEFESVLWILTRVLLTVHTSTKQTMSRPSQ